MSDEKVTAERVEEIRRIANSTRSIDAWPAIDDLLAYIDQQAETIAYLNEELTEALSTSAARGGTIARLEKLVADEVGSCTVNGCPGTLEVWCSSCQAVGEIPNHQETIARLEREVYEAHEDRCWERGEDAYGIYPGSPMAMYDDACPTCRKVYEREEATDASEPDPRR